MFVFPQRSAWICHVFGFSLRFDSTALLHTKERAGKFLSPLIRGCLPRVSRQEPCVSLLFNPPFEMGETGFHWLSPQGRLPLSSSGSAAAHLEAIWGSDPSRCCLAIFFFPVLFGSRASRLPSKHLLLFFSAEGSFKGLMGICRAPPVAESRKSRVRIRRVTGML